MMIYNKNISLVGNAIWLIIVYYKKIRKKLENNNYNIIVEGFLGLTVDELNKLLYEFHSKFCHSNYKYLKYIFY